MGNDNTTKSGSSCSSSNQGGKVVSSPGAVLEVRQLSMPASVQQAISAALSASKAGTSGK